MIEVKNSLQCEGQHRYFALEMVVEADNTIKIPLVCTQCGDLKVHEISATLKVK